MANPFHGMGPVHVGGLGHYGFGTLFSHFPACMDLNAIPKSYTIDCPANVLSLVYFMHIGLVHESAVMQSYAAVFNHTFCG